MISQSDSFEKKFSYFLDVIEHCPATYVASFWKMLSVPVTELSDEQQFKCWIRLNSTETAQALKKEGFDPTVRGKDGQPPLLHLLNPEKNHNPLQYEHVKALLDVGAFKNNINNVKHLSMAFVRSPDRRAIKALLETHFQ